MATCVLNRISISRVLLLNDTLKAAVRDNSRVQLIGQALFNAQATSVEIYSTQTSNTHDDEDSNATTIVPTEREIEYLDGT